MGVNVKNIWEICEFEDEVIYGNLKAERFAVELHQVLEGRAAELYLSPRLFLSHTYPTETMKYLLREALRRLSGRGGQPVFILDTEFGGGKTHTLLLLYYVFKDREVGTAYIRELNLHKETGVSRSPNAVCWQ
jgi:predicted AAA+ superfamily ATPase